MNSTALSPHPSQSDATAIRSATAMHSSGQAQAEVSPRVQFPALRDPRFPVHQIADRLEPYLRVIVEKFHPEKIILFGSYAYGQPTEHSDVDLLVVRRDIRSEKESNMEIRHEFWVMEDELLPFTILSKTPETLLGCLAENSSFFQEIVGKGVQIYAAPSDP